MYNFVLLICNAGADLITQRRCHPSEHHREGTWLLLVSFSHSTAGTARECGTISLEKKFIREDRIRL